ncbi:hypothetical protein, partial [uncultured Deefgea sp.]|uniref:hypothetical protein n=1 Tax=uncultured Deefgea sp. TaxID=1304914 RepID=UPI00259A8914
NQSVPQAQEIKRYASVSLQLQKIKKDGSITVDVYGGLSLTLRNPPYEPNQSVPQAQEIRRYASVSSQLQKIKKDGSITVDVYGGLSLTLC